MVVFVVLLLRNMSVGLQIAQPVVVKVLHRCDFLKKKSIAPLCDAQRASRDRLDNDE